MDNPRDDRILIIGAGVFGLGLAHELASQRGYTNVTVLDRSLPPVPDGSSVDISRIIRTEYADPLYTRMATEALAGWRTRYSPYYRESGFVMLAAADLHPYIVKAVENGTENKSTAQWFSADQADAAIKSIYPAVQARIDGLAAMYNPEGGWADAEASITALARAACLAGVSFVSGKRGTVTQLNYDADGTTVVGVRVLSGEDLPASRVVVATGAWTNSLVPGVNHAASASGQPVAFVQLTPEEAASLESSPVIVNMTTGVFCFPPSPNHILKLARHGYGYATNIPVDPPGSVGKNQRIVSTPKRDGDNSASGYLPDDADDALREGLRQFFPAFGDRAWSKRRLCWYTDTPEGDFIVDQHPSVGGLFIATGGSGHAFKFLPVLGSYLADCFENKAPEELRKKWRLRAANGEEAMPMAGDGSRAGPPLRVLSKLEQSLLGQNPNRHRERLMNGPDIFDHM